MLTTIELRNGRKCVMCSENAEVIVSWPASQRIEHEVCHRCARNVWDILHEQYSGTESFMGFTITPIDRVNDWLIARCRENEEGQGH